MKLQLSPSGSVWVAVFDGFYSPGLLGHLPMMLLLLCLVQVLNMVHLNHLCLIVVLVEEVELLPMVVLMDWVFVDYSHQHQNSPTLLPPIFSLPRPAARPHGNCRSGLTLWRLSSSALGSRRGSPLWWERYPEQTRKKQRINTTPPSL